MAQRFIFWNGRIDSDTSIFCCRFYEMKICSNCKGTNVAEIPWGYPSRELLERSVDENDDPFVYKCDETYLIYVH